MTGKLASWTIAHFTVDMGCIYILYKGVWAYYFDSSLLTLGAAIMLYNCIAFGLQMVIGYIADKHPKMEKAIGPIGLGGMLIPLVILGFSQGAMASWVSLVLCALFNATFHVGGGMDVLKTSNGKIAPSGIFVSSGALGVISGTLYGGAGHDILLPVGVTLLAVLFLYLFTKKQPTNLYSEDWESSAIKLTGHGMGFICACLFVAIFIRSFSGLVWPIGFEKTGMLVALPAIASCLGKALGGILADKIGALETAVVSLSLSIVLPFISTDLWVVIGLSILFFNMAMPITLCGLAAVMPENTGFAFGLSTFALLLGYIAYALLTSFCKTTSNYSIYIITILGIVAILLIALALRTKNKKQHVG